LIEAGSATVRIGITGAGGFVGAGLVDALAARHAGSAEVVAIDARLGSLAAGVTRAEGDLTDAGFRSGLFARQFDAFFHLAAIPGGAAARDYALGWRVNVDATVAILEALAAQPKPSRLVFASSIGVFGVPLPRDTVDDDTLPLPTMSYGAQKLMMEALVADVARRGLADGLALRLPGIVARPRQPGGHLSAYMSDVLHALAAGENFTCPVAAEATAWFMSRACVVDNLIHAAELPGDRIGSRRAFNLPALHLSMRQFVDGAAELFGPQVRSLVSYQPNEALQAQFGSYPPLLTPIADALGFRHDGNAASLAARGLDREPTRTRGAA
jgi:nucleoside-diphosphate-sugar epimerase